MKPSAIAHKYPTYRDDPVKGCKKWLDGKRIDDNAEGLWRIHDKLYDLTEFLSRHPGGQEWLKITKGVDITEQFETHHITSVAEKMLPKFYVRDAALPRNYKTTFEENGFYKTLQRRVANKLNFLDQSSVSNSRFYSDLMLATTFLFSITAARDNNYVVASFASLSLLWLTIIAHNFIHQKDNWRMYLMNISLISFHEWRVFHAMSHHLYPNSYHDLEMSFFEPWLNWIPEKKSLLQTVGYFIASPIAYAFLFIMGFYNRVMSVLFYNEKPYWDDLLSLALPTLMYTFGSTNVWIVVKVWAFIITLASFMYGFIGINAGHHHQKVFHDGDELKSVDFGIYQLSATVDKIEVKNSHFLTLTNFGHHVLHHFFPTLDHGVLPQLHETLISTCMEFEADMREFPWWQLVVGQFKQLARTEPMKINGD